MADLLWAKSAIYVWLFEKILSFNITQFADTKEDNLITTSSLIVSRDVTLNVSVCSTSQARNVSHVNFSGKYERPSLFGASSDFPED